MLADAIYQPNKKDSDALKLAMHHSGASNHEEPTSSERSRFIRTYITGGQETVQRILKAVRIHIQQDRRDAEGMGQTYHMPKHNPGSSEAVKAGAALISKDFLPILQQQLVHIMNRCVADPPGMVPYVEGKKVNFRNSGVELQAWTSLRGTSRVEVWHSVCAKSFACLSGISQRTYDARIGWLLLHYNCRCQS